MLDPPLPEEDRGHRDPTGRDAEPATGPVRPTRRPAAEAAGVRPAARHSAELGGESSSRSRRRHAPATRTGIPTWRRPRVEAVRRPVAHAGDANGIGRVPVMFGDRCSRPVHSGSFDRLLTGRDVDALPDPSREPTDRIEDPQIGRPPRDGVDAFPMHAICSRVRLPL